MDDETKVLYMIGRFIDNALNWAAPIAQNPLHPLRHDYEAFRNQLESVYRDNTSRIDAINRIGRLRRTRSVANHSTEFITLASFQGYNEQAMYAEFYIGLKAEIKKALGIAGLPTTFATLCAKAVEIHHVTSIIDKDTKRSTPSATKPSGSTSGSTPTPTSGPTRPKRLSADEKERPKEIGIVFCL